MRTTALDSLPPIHKEIIPDRDPMTGERFKATGLTEGGETIWLSHALDFEAMRENRVQVTNHEGEPVYRKGADQYEYPVWRVPVIWMEERFLLRSMGNAKVQKVRRWEATEEEKLRAERRRQREGFMETLVDLSLDRGLNPEELLDSVLQARAAGEITNEPAELDPVPVDTDEAPVSVLDAPELRDSDDVAADPTEGYTDADIEGLLEHKGGGNYLLTNEETVKGKDAAIEAQREILRQQVADTDSGPEF